RLLRQLVARRHERGLEVGGLLRAQRALVDELLQERLDQLPAAVSMLAQLVEEDGPVSPRADALGDFPRVLAQPAVPIRVSPAGESVGRRDAEIDGHRTVSYHGVSLRVTARGADSCSGPPRAPGSAASGSREGPAANRPRRAKEACSARSGAGTGSCRRRSSRRCRTARAGPPAPRRRS